MKKVRVVWAPQVELTVRDEADYDEIVEEARGLFKEMCETEYKDNITEVLVVNDGASWVDPDAFYRVIGNECYHGFSLGTIVRQVDADDTLFEDESGAQWWVGPTDLEKLN